MEQKKEKKYLIGSIICGLLTAFGIAATIVSLIGGSQGIWVLSDCCRLVLFLLIAYYAFIGYKKPHGNLLKYVILFRAVLVLISIPSMIQAENTLLVVMRTIELGLMCYIAGRLVKAKENLILMMILAVAFVIVLVSDVIEGNVNIGAVAPLITWLDICVAYFLRYKQHREAGLMDAPKK